MRSLLTAAALISSSQAEFFPTDTTAVRARFTAITFWKGTFLGTQENSADTTSNCAESFTKTQVVATAFYTEVTDFADWIAENRK